MAKPGLLFVKSRVTKPNELSETQFIEWYEKVHIPDILSTKGVDTAYRYTNVDPNGDFRFLAMYPVHDISFFQSEEFKNIPDTSKPYFKDGRASEFAAFELRMYERIQLFEPEGTKEGRAPCMGAVSIEPATGTDEDFDDWYRRQHLDMLSMTTGYRRSIRYKLIGSTRKDAPSWVAIHEYDSTNTPRDGIIITTKTEWSKKILGTAKAFEADWWKLENQFGKTPEI